MAALRLPLWMMKRGEKGVEKHTYGRNMGDSKNIHICVTGKEIASLFKARVGSLFLVSLAKNSIVTFQHLVIEVV